MDANSRKSSLVYLGALIAFFLAVGARAADISVIVGFHGTPDGGIFARHGGEARTELQALRAHAGRVPLRALAALRAAPGVAYVEEDLVAEASSHAPPNDTYYAGYQADDYGLIKCPGTPDGPGAWHVSQGAGVRVAVLDTGCQLTHPDIGSGSSGKVKVWKNFTSSSTSNVGDGNGHGTHTAGTVGARTNNNKGVAAAGYNCELAIGKVLTNSGSGYYSWIASGINWSVSSTVGAKVISMSLGGSGYSTTLENAVNAAWNNGNGAVLVAAAGNNGNNSLSYPAAYTNCISVAATGNTGARASFSNYGLTVDIAAPGVSIASTYKGSSYALMSGTSMATPHVAGVAALVWATSYGTSSSSVRKQIEKNASVAVPTPDGSPLKLLDAAAAVLVPAP